MGLLKQIFTWWDGATIGTALHTRRNGVRVGEDAFGNVYYEAKKDGSVTWGVPRRRWVIYAGSNDASRVAPEWHGWLHGQIDAVPDQALPPPRSWVKEPAPNLTGTPQAYKPAGALDRGGRRAAGTGDYEAWSPN
jgi:NADH:ubiquinone oxidoreductase subunit